MGTKPSPIPAGQFTAKGFAILAEMTLMPPTNVVTERGNPVAEVAPIDQPEPDNVPDSTLWEDDIISPIDETVPVGWRQRPG